MQMNGNGIICTGYLYVNPGVTTFSANGYPTSRSFAPAVGTRAKISWYSSSDTNVTWILSGTYVIPGPFGITTDPSGTEFVENYTTKTIFPSYIRYA